MSVEIRVRPVYLTITFLSKLNQATGPKQIDDIAIYAVFLDRSQVRL